jgi:type II secretory pathway pseudopilin PulG
VTLIMIVIVGMVAAVGVAYWWLWRDKDRRRWVYKCKWCGRRSTTNLGLWASETLCWKCHHERLPPTGDAWSAPQMNYTSDQQVREKLADEYLQRVRRRVL